jgi:hypothetical protein
LRGTECENKRAAGVAGKKGATWQIAGDRFLFQVPGVARFLLRGGREILFEAAPGAGRWKRHAA